MHYFRISQDCRKNMTFNYKENEDIILEKSLEENEYVDFIQRSKILVSEELKKLIEVYQEEVSVQTLTMNDFKKMSQKRYWQIELPKLKGIHQKTRFKKDGTIEKLVIDETEIFPYKIFVVQTDLESVIIASLDIVESMIRRNFTGMIFQEVEKEGIIWNL